ncbi:hypothetical protein CPJCM30710_33360 [Clostridium polyendosporum]|uniref:Uncharacterized protein n=1 Tax=Clostridium polyendosporum TaxID=69208 RepID=A0A919S3P2_9CLOT|nr:hypothetical protein [Clostridium polyendosporum]GIM30670.1 hypothetical protein CPJCM30710_33360 [Clostridium polyendosporum]
MKIKDKNVSKKSRKFSVSIVLYVVASVVGLVGIALLISNILLFRDTVNQYVTQGYPKATVINKLIPTQLLPGIFEPIAVYEGIAFVLVGVGIVNKKISKCLTLLTKVEVCNDAIEESILEQNVVGIENTETIEQIEIVEEAKKA